MVADGGSFLFALVILYLFFLYFLDSSKAISGMDSTSPRLVF